MNFQSLNHFNEFCNYIENSTNLYTLDFLGFPWYKTVKDNLNNTISLSRPISISEQHRNIREKDFLDKMSLLERTYDYVFIAKAKMRRKDLNNYENFLMYDVYDYLASKGEKFIILEEPSGEEFDTKYLMSKYYEITVPIEFLVESWEVNDNYLLRYKQRDYLYLVDKLFEGFSLSMKWIKYVDLLRERYRHFANEIPRILFWQTLISKIGAKALFGGMGTHFYPGLNNSFAVVEIAHGYRLSSLAISPASTPLEQYDQTHFYLDRFFTLVPSATRTLYNREGICLEKNRYYYGMPELRAYLKSSSRAKETINKYDLNNRYVILIATTGWINYESFNRVLRAICERFPQAKILLRPHPHYDDVSKVNYENQNITLVEHENKYDLFSVSDVVISSLSSMVVEANMFTDNIIVYPNNYSASPNDLKSLNKLYPYAEIISLEDTHRLIERLEYYGNNPSKKNPNCNVSDYLIDLAKLFTDIDRVIEDNQVLDRNVQSIETVKVKSTENTDISLSPEELNRNGESLFAEGNIEGARKIFERAIQIKPDYANAINNLGVVYWEMNMFTQGLMQFEKAHSINPSDRNITFNYSDALRHQGFHSRANKVIQSLNMSTLKDE